MDNERVDKKLFESETGGRRRKGKTWIETGGEDVEKDLRETKVKRWRQKAVGRKERPSVIKQGKTLRMQ